MVVDQKNMLRLWLEEKIARHEMTAAQADAMIRDSGSAAKNWISLPKTHWAVLSCSRSGAGLRVMERRQQLQNSRLVHDLERDVDWLTGRIAKYGDHFRGRLSHLW